MAPAIIAHGLAAGHADRVPELARLHGWLAGAVAAGGVDSDAAREAHAALAARIGEWMVADREAERRDVVPLTADERATLLREIDRAIPIAARAHAWSPPTPDEPDVVAPLQRLRAAFPEVLPRAALVRFRRSAARLARLEALGAPEVIIGNEPRILLCEIESAIEPIVRPTLPFDPSRGFQQGLYLGMDACVIREPGAAQGVNLGLGTSLAVAAVLGVTGDDYGALHERWVDSASPSHPFARYPLVPASRFCRVTAARLVRADFEETGPIGWAAAGDVDALARDIAALAAGHPSFGAELRAVADRLATASRRGHAVVGLIEYLSPEADGESLWFADPEGDA